MVRIPHPGQQWPRLENLGWNRTEALYVKLGVACICHLKALQEIFCVQSGPGISLSLSFPWP